LIGDQISGDYVGDTIVIVLKFETLDLGILGEIELRVRKKYGRNFIDDLIY